MSCGSATFGHKPRVRSFAPSLAGKGGLRPRWGPRVTRRSAGEGNAVSYLPSGSSHGRLCSSASPTQRGRRFPRSVRTALPRGPPRPLEQKQRERISGPRPRREVRGGAGLPRPRALGLHAPPVRSAAGALRDRGPRTADPGPARRLAGWKPQAGASYAGHTQSTGSLAKLDALLTRLPGIQKSLKNGSLRLIISALVKHLPVESSSELCIYVERQNPTSSVSNLKPWSKT